MRVARACVLLALGCAPAVEPCNISERDCQEDVYYTMLRYRGDGVDPFAGLPPIERITLDEHRARVARASAAPAEPTAWDLAFTALGLLDARATLSAAGAESFASNVAAYYAPDVKTVTVIDRPRAGDDLTTDMSTLAHELVHAVQDREFDLQRRSTTWDASLADSALVEGDAVLYQSLAWTEFLGQDLSKIEWTQYYSRYSHAALDAVTAGPDRLFRAYLLAYPFGGEYLTRAWESGGNGEVRAAYERTPAQSVHFLVGYGKRRPGTHTARADCVPAPPPGFVSHGTTVLGAFELYAYLVGARVSWTEAITLASGWLADRLAVYEDPSGAVALTWHIQLEGALSADALTAVARDGVVIETAANEVLVTATRPAARPADWTPALRECAPPR